MILSSTSTSTGLRPEYEYDQSQNGGHHPAAGNDFQLANRPAPRLGVSRPGSLGFRLSFVFAVVHLFPWVVSQYDNLAALTFGPS